jgi:hypothetical protein
MIPGPGRGWALVICDQEAILCTPEEYWSVTVFPGHSAQLNSSIPNLACGHTNVGKLSVFKDQKVQLLAQFLQLLCEIKSKVLDNIAVSLSSVQSNPVPTSYPRLVVQTYLDHTNTRSDSFDDIQYLLGSSDIH